MITTAPDPTHVLPPALYRSALNALRAVLPPPLTGNPADTTERDLEAMAQVASLGPANAAEIALAVQFVANHALSMDIMQVITESPVDALKHWAASANMGRHSRGALSSLLRLQAARKKEARGIEVVRRLDPIATRLPPPDDEAPPVPTVTDSETESRISDNETLMRPDDAVTAATIPDNRPKAAPFVPDPAIIARLVADKALTSRLNAVSTRPAARHNSSPARFVPRYETVSRVPGYETGVRRRETAGASPAETSVDFAGIETPVRQDVYPSERVSLT